MHAKSTRGFTLIELLVVIAIIGILSSVVLASLNSARIKGRDSAIKASMTQVRNAMELLVSNANGVYSAGLCTDASMTGILANAAGNGPSGTTVQTNAIGASTKVTCNSTASGWATEAPLATSGSYMCTDSTGAMKTENAVSLTAASTVLCP